MLKMVDDTGIIGVDMVCPLGGAVSPPQPPNYDNIEMEGVGSLMLPNSLKAPLERVELIGNSMQGENPSPDNPQEIKSAGRKSRNLLIENMSVFTVQDNIAYIPLPEGHETKLYTMLIRKKPNKNDDIGFSCGFYDKSNANEVYSAPCLKDGKLINENGIVNSKVGVNHFICFKPANEKFFDIYNVMYVEGKETTLDYEPYGYLLDLKVTGNNLFDISKVQNTSELINNGDGTLTLTAKNASGKSTLKEMCPDLIVGETYTLKFDTNGINYIYCEGVWSDGASKQITQAMLDSIVFFYNNMGVSVVTIKNIQINRGTKAMPYSQYCIPQTVQIGIDEPLRGIGEYKDTITKDGVVRKILEAPIAEYLQNAIYGNPGEKYISSSVPKCYINYDKNKCMSNIGFASNAENKKYIPIPRLESFLIKVSDDDTVETIKEKMKDVIVAYTTKEPVTEPLPESVQAQLSSLHSENGTTHINIDSGEVPCGIKLTYRKEK